MEKPELLRLFDRVRAEAGEPICWSHLHTPVRFLGMTDSGCVAVMTERGVVETPTVFSLRMKPLFWLDEKPVYKGDKLWHKLACKMVTVGGLQPDPLAEAKKWFLSANGTRYSGELCQWDEPEETKVLFVLDDKPVTPGTRLWHEMEKDFVVIEGPSNNGDFVDSNGIGRSPCFLRWKGKKTNTLYANVYTSGHGFYIGGVHETEQLAKAYASCNSLGIARVEWETEEAA